MNEYDIHVSHQNIHREGFFISGEYNPEEVRL